MVISPIPSRLDRRTAVRLLLIALAVVFGCFGVLLLVLFFAVSLRPLALEIIAWVVFAVSLLGMLLLYRSLRNHGYSLRDVGFVRPSWRLLHFLWQLPSALLVLVAVQGIVATLMQSDITKSGVLQNANISTLSAVFAFVGMAILVPFWEEALFRGVIYGQFRRRLGVFLSALVAGGIFALAHGIPILLPYLLTFGIINCLLYEFHRSLWAPVALHAFINGIVNWQLLSRLIAS